MMNWETLIKEQISSQKFPKFSIFLNCSESINKNAEDFWKG